MTYRVWVDVAVPMRDGVDLAANIWQPDADDPMPALLVRNPYGKDELANYGFMSPNIFQLVDAGYAVVIQECRGTFGSAGHYTPHVNEAADGADTVSWLTEQDWCDGNVGTWGVSYLGMVQWQTAATGVAGLKAMAPAIASADLYRAPYYSPGGAFSLDTILTFASLMSANDAARTLRFGAGDPTDSSDSVRRWVIRRAWRGSPRPQHTPCWPSTRRGSSRRRWATQTATRCGDHCPRWTTLRQLRCRR